jgi:hypothetical protein
MTTSPAEAPDEPVDSCREPLASLRLAPEDTTMSPLTLELLSPVVICTEPLRPSRLAPDAMDT